MAGELSHETRPANNRKSSGNTLEKKEKSAPRPSLVESGFVLEGGMDWMNLQGLSFMGISRLWLVQQISVPPGCPQVCPRLR